MTARTAVGRLVAEVRSRVQRSKTGAHRYDPSEVTNEHLLGAEDYPRHDVPETEAGKIASIFADVIEGGDLADLGDLLADEVVYLVPGRSGAAGLHHGHEAVAQALAQETSEDTTVSVVEVTEVIAAATRSVVVVRFAGRVGGEPFDYETAFHLRTSNGAVVAITEYSGDQYRADRVARRR
jgi:ketosteroid isomerase-like protein